VEKQRGDTVKTIGLLLAFGLLPLLMDHWYENGS